MSKEREDGLDRGVEIVAIRKGSASFVSLSSPNSKHEVVLSTDVHGTRLALEEDILNGTDNNVFVEHTWSFTDVARRLSTAIDVENPKQSAGLTDAIALARLKQIGKNLLTPPYIEPKWQKFLRQFKNWFIVMLFFSGLLSFITYAIYPTAPVNLYLGLLLMGDVLITCYLSFSQEAKSAAVMESFRVMLPSECTVTRSGKRQRTLAEDLVVGDLVMLKTGDKVPADLRIIYCNGLMVDQSMLTGESEPQPKSEARFAEKNPLESMNLAFSGSLCVDGEAAGIVVRTGDKTLIGSLANLAGNGEKVLTETTLQKEITTFVRLIAVMSVVMAIIIFIVGVSQGEDVLTTFINGFLVMLVANIPQGLPITVSSCLVIVAKRMKEQNVYVKRLDIIETLGCVSVICSDKTGTLTQNRMTVSHLWANSEAAVPAESSKSGDGDTNYPLQALIRAAALNTRVEMGQDGAMGDATELGLFNFASSVLNVDRVQHFNPKVYEIPFNSVNKWQLTVHALGDHGGKKAQVFVKGAPERVISRCTTYMGSAGVPVKIDEQFLQLLNTIYEMRGGQGERVLGFATSSKLHDVTAFTEDSVLHDRAFRTMVEEKYMQDLCFLGFITLQDPPRPEVSKAIDACRSAGVKTIMVTGDHRITAAAIARQIGLITHPTKDELAKERGVDVDRIDEAEVQSVVVVGTELEKFTDKDWETVLSKPEIVFSRTSPQQKFTIVERIQERGQVIAMTGDGVNDSPALKKANVGVAMGISGSDVAREAADIILLDDNFSSIVAGVHEGRLLFDNLTKTTAYTITHLWPEVVPVIINFGLSMPLGLSSILVLCVDLYSELLPAVSLAWEGPETDIMKRPPRVPGKDHLVSMQLLAYAYLQAGMFETFACLLVYFKIFAEYGLSPHELIGKSTNYFQTGAPDLHTRNKVLTDTDQLELLALVQSAWYVILVCSQFTHIFTARTRTSSMFKHGLFTNGVTNIAIVGELLLMLFVIYSPFLQPYLGTYTVPAKFYWPALVSFAMLWSWGEGRKAISRSYPNSLFTKLFIF